MLRLQKLLSHLTMILGGMFLTFFLIDRVNTAMCFLDNEISKWLLFCFSVCAITLCILTLLRIRREEK